ncbi:MAG: ABC transporter ATP-binding protein [Clostridia bacterium]|nr:ABC transporter ATP-binding protein [Clostridia bacterium]
MPKIYLQTQSLVVGYDGKPLIRDISLDVSRGEIVTLIGPNGSGKSTILKSITRQLKTLGGTVEIDGSALHSLSYKSLATRMAVVLTERMKPELMTCWDIVASGRYPYTGRLGLLTKEDREKTAAAMEAVHALDLRDRDFNAISDGQRQRVLLARAICQEPELIVLDEPTSFLDIRHKLELLEILRKMARERQIAVILSLHEIDLAQKVSDWVVCVKGETIARAGKPEEVFQADAIEQLYGLRGGTYDPEFGSIELPAIQGNPRALVLSSGGSGIPVYRRLQREQTPFAAGILYTNDIDSRLARVLAQEVVAETPFMPIGEAALRRALELTNTCERVIDAGICIGEINRAMERVMQQAKQSGKLMTAAQL